ncbi:fibronectin type III domain-containing protein [Paenarthrobacter sp. AB444]|uniref:fibronectin type III domain-containing protein n=1 Tax=Paenarthrobacter sp. AB444 TaxID=3025681 RepID=UPI0023658358|nr:fibronectin type III domain-containing protein [Paenarthrobacter sp. AB444]MDD7833747.1 fibronectin type III domain-containing protein [Paenarthrobacter sp. AB444]
MNSKLHEPGGPRLRVGYGRAGTIAGVSAVLCATSLMAIPSASAAVPTFPDNLVVFPDRDFITIEGYQDRVGQTALVEVTRKGAGVIGSAQGVVTAGDVAFEINHPGGYCWGAGTGLNVTPDIQPGDVVSIKFNGADAGATTVQDAYVTEHSSLSGTTLTVRGHAGAGVNPAQMEQRIVEPALKDTSVGRRDIRAVPGELTAADGYSSSLVFGNDGTFTATYEFNDAATAGIAAAASGERAMAWEVEDADANRQGLTIAEFGELGGPGMGGCPNGPLQSGPVGPTDVKVAKVNGDVKVNWTPAQAIPGTPAITGYRVTAVGRTVTGHEQSEAGVRISDPRASSTTIKGLPSGEDYDVYVVSVSAAGETFPAVPFIAETDTTQPTVTASPGGGTFSTAQKLTLTANEQGCDIFYTVDGSDPIGSGGVAAEGATLYKDPVPVTDSGKFTFAAIDPSGNVSDKGSVEFIITNDPVPDAPAFTGAPVAGKGNATVSWSAPNPGAEGLTISGYTVQAFTEEGVAFGTGQKVAGDVTSLVYEGLAGDTQYRFTVRATNINGDGPESPMSDPVTVQGETVANAGPDQNVNRGTTATTVTLDGTGSTTAGATYQWRQVLASPTDPDAVTLAGSTTLQPTFSLPVYKYPMTNKPLTFELTVTAGGGAKTDVVSVTPVPDRVTAGQAQWKSRDFRVTGTSSAVGGTISIRVGGPGGTVIGTAPVTAAVAPETGGVFTLRLRDGNAPATNPGTIWVESTLGGTAGPITVVNK